MKSAADILKEIGFKPDASIDVQKAFFKHLVKVADTNQLKREEKPKTEKKPEPIQLEFDLGETKRVS